MLMTLTFCCWWVRKSFNWFVWLTLRDFLYVMWGVLTAHTSNKVIYRLTLCPLFLLKHHSFPPSFLPLSPIFSLFSLSLFSLSLSLSLFSLSLSLLSVLLSLYHFPSHLSSLKHCYKTVYESRVYYYLYSGPRKNKTENYWCFITT